MQGRLKIRINSKFEHLRDKIALLPDTIPQNGEIIYDDRNTIYRITIGDVDSTVKAFHIPAFFNRIAYTFFRHSKARRSYDNAVRLESLGIGTPEPIACIEEYKNSLLRRSYYVCRMVEGQNIRHWETEVPDYKQMIRAFAAFTYGLHSKGVYHKDYSPGNILFTRDGAGKYHFYMVDINRMEFGVKDKRRLYRNFRCLNIDSEEETARVAREYASFAGLDADRMGNLAIKLLRRYHAVKARHRLLKRLLRKKR